MTRAPCLWRGESVLEELPLPAPLRCESARLERLRATVVDASLEAGRHGEMLADLETLTRRDPLNERLTAQLMLALYRSGRRRGRCDEGPNGHDLRVPPGERRRRDLCHLKFAQPRPALAWFGQVPAIPAVDVDQ
ncbi:BTAD domain-containing putative transcriptional regulator [Nonomuraea aurantiaca]|uniref:BTAD domain-containing putative transcriptional regulator n=1 Tax=Nonomuraea aurantiaca TaxID=2878562 RepID=UPI0021E6734B|nr:BTAD domain-containing putative transcriptional regulator [Nonomuraea aurantiaca]